MIKRVKNRKLEIVIRIRQWERFDEFLEKRIVPIKERYPYAKVRIEVDA